MRGASPSHVATSVVVLVLAVVIASGCGSDDAPSPTATTTATRATTTTSTSSSVATTPSVPATTPAPNARVAVATGRALDALARAYGPVSARVNFLVAAEVLWRDAVDNDGTRALQRTRAGAVRLEILRMMPILVRTQAAVRRTVQTQPGTREIQQLLLSAISNRTIALKRLDALLDVSSDDTSDDDVATLDDRYRAAWNASARDARTATGAIQELRASLGLDPAREEAVR